MSTTVNLTQAYEIINDFFHSEEVSSAFKVLAEYTYSLDERVIIRYNNDIIGVSHPASRFIFYISRGNGYFFIKFQTEYSKRPFIPDQIDTYIEPCHKSTAFMESQYRPMLSSSNYKKYRTRTRDNDDKPEYSSLIARCNELLCQCKTIFEQYANLSLSKVFFGQRIYSVLTRNGFTTYEELTSLTANDYLSIKGFGLSSLNNLVCIYEDLLEENAPEVLLTPPKVVWCDLTKKAETVVNLGKEAFELNESEFNQILNVYDELFDLYRKIFLSNPVGNLRNWRIFVYRNMYCKKLQEVGDTFNLSRERIRQLCDKYYRRAKRILHSGKIEQDYIRALEGLLNSLDEKIYACLLKFLYQHEPFLFDMLQCSIISDDTSIDLIGYLCNISYTVYN